MTVSLESDYFKTSLEYDRIHLLTGIKQSGKSYMLMQWIKYAMSLKRFSHYYLMLPGFLTEADDQYAWLKSFSCVTIFTKYSPKIIEMIRKDNKPGSKCFCLDDSTNYGSEFKTDPSFLELVTTSRHMKISMVLVVHSLKSILSTGIRNNIDNIFMFKITNENLLKTVSEEYLSALTKDFKNYKEFVGYYIERVNSVKYGCMFIPLTGTYPAPFDSDVKSWNFMNIKFVINKKPIKKPQPKKSNNAVKPNYKKFMLNDKPRNIATNFIRTGRNHQ